MDLEFLLEYSVPVIIGICLCVGFVIKSSLDFVPNKYIPLIMAVMGLGINTAISGTMSAEIALGGMFSGLVSTGMYELFRNLIERNGKGM